MQGLAECEPIYPLIAQQEAVQVREVVGAGREPSLLGWS